jgi:hypothetical protein
MPTPPYARSDRLPAALRPRNVTAELPSVRQVDAAERELRLHAERDRQQCWGYFPVLAGQPGIGSDLPACRDFAIVMPYVMTDGECHQFNFIRLSLTCQSQQAAYHLDSDAATALTGDLATLRRREVGRVLLNLSSTQARALHYLDLDVSTAILSSQGSYVRSADESQEARHAASATIPPRSGRTVHGIVFVANRVLHSGVDGPLGHFVAAYGYDRADVRARRSPEPAHMASDLGGPGRT